MVTLAELEEKKQAYFFPKRFKAQDRKKIELDELRRLDRWRCDDCIILRKSPRPRAEGLPEDKIYYDTLAYVPLTFDSGGAYVWITSSEPVIRLAYQIGYDEFPDEEHEGAYLKICKDILEGDLKIGYVQKEYGKKGKFDVPTIIGV